MLEKQWLFKCLFYTGQDLKFNIFTSSGFDCWYVKDYHLRKTKFCLSDDDLIYLVFFSGGAICSNICITVLFSAYGLIQEIFDSFHFSLEKKDCLLRSSGGSLPVTIITTYPLYRERQHMQVFSYAPLFLASPSTRNFGLFFLDYFQVIFLKPLLSGKDSRK